MKTRSIARGIVGSVAALLGVMAAGCSADVSDPQSGEAEIGSTAQAITINSLTTAFTGSARWLSGSCMLDDTTDKMVVFGGYDSSGNGLDDAYLFTPGTGWTALDAVTDTQTVGGANDPAFDNQGRGEVKGIALDSHTCLFVGGKATKSGTTMRTQALIVDVNGSAHHQWSQAGAITGRAKFAISKCGSGDIIVVGGHDGTSGDVTPVSGTASIQRRNGATGTTSWSSMLALPHLVSAFAFDALSDNKHFAVAGGQDASGPVALVQAFRDSSVNGDCSTLTAVPAVETGAADADELRSPSNTANVAARLGPVALFTPNHDSDANTDLLYVTGGSIGATLPLDAQPFLVTWTGGSAGIAYDNAKRVASALPTGTRLPTYAKVSATQAVAVGGEQADSTTALAATPVNQAQTITVSATPSISIAGAQLADTTGSPANDGSRLGSAAEYLPSSSKVFATVGLYDQTGPLLLQSTESITP